MATHTFFDGTFTVKTTAGGKSYTDTLNASTASKVFDFYTAHPSVTAAITSMQITKVVAAAGKLTKATRYKKNGNVFEIDSAVNLNSLPYTVDHTATDTYYLWSSDNTGIAQHYWISSSADSTHIASGKPISEAITAAAWNSYRTTLIAICDKICCPTFYYDGQWPWRAVFTDGRIWASEFNVFRQVLLNIINFLSPLYASVRNITVPAAVASGDTFAASLFHGSGSIKDAHNKLVSAVLSIS